MSKWTPGPWEWTVADRIKGHDPDTGKPVLVVRLLRSTDKRGNEPECQLNRWDADAHLIAAAPDLYEAIQAAIDCGMVPVSSAEDGGASKYSKQVQVADQIRAALAKARGEV